MPPSLHVLRSPYAGLPVASGGSDFGAVLQCFEQTLVGGLHLFQANSASQAGAVAGFLFALLRYLHSSKIMWVSQRTVCSNGGVIYGPGLLESGFPPDRLLFVEASRSRDVLWALEEGLRSKAVQAVVGEFAGDLNAIDLTTTRRLALRSEAARVPVYLAPIAGEVGATAARTRWRVSSAPSCPARGPALLGDPSWALDLTKNRSGPCCRTTIGYSSARGKFFPVVTKTRDASDKTAFDHKSQAAIAAASVVIPFTTALRKDEGDGR